MHNFVSSSSVEPGLLGLGRSDPFFEIAKKNVDHATGVVRWYESNDWYSARSCFDVVSRFTALALQELCVSIRAYRRPSQSILE